MFEVLEKPFDRLFKVEEALLIDARPVFTAEPKPVEAKPLFAADVSPVFAEAKSVRAEARPVFIEPTPVSRPVFTELKSVPKQSIPVFKVEPKPVETRPVEARPELSPVCAEVRAVFAEARPALAEARPEVTEVDPVVEVLFPGTKERSAARSIFVLRALVECVPSKALFIAVEPVLRTDPSKLVLVMAVVCPEGARIVTGVSSPTFCRPMAPLLEAVAT